MPIRLQAVTDDNLFDTVHMMTSAEQWEAYQRFNELVKPYFVSSNLVSMAEAAVNAGAEPRAIYADDQIVGFIMVAPDTHEGKSGYYIWRLMIDYRFQRQGYGRAAMEAMLAELEARSDCTHFSISCVPENTIAVRLYESLGFVATGEMEDDEIILRRMVQR